jgi:hypothetical protein
MVHSDMGRAWPLAVGANCGMFGVGVAHGYFVKYKEKD